MGEKAIPPTAAPPPDAAEAEREIVPPPPDAAEAEREIVENGSGPRSDSVGAADPTPDDAADADRARAICRAVGSRLNVEPLVPTPPDTADLPPLLLAEVDRFSDDIAEVDRFIRSEDPIGNPSISLKPSEGEV